MKSKKLFIIISVITALIAIISLALLSIAHNKALGVKAEAILVSISGLSTYASLFSNSFAQKLAEETVKKAFLKDQTEIVEEVKKEFNIGIERLKSELTKNRIAFEVNYSIYSTEESKAIINLYSKLDKFYHSALGLASIWDLSQQKGKQFNDYRQQHLEQFDKYYSSLNEACDAIDYSVLFLGNDLTTALNIFVNKIDDISKCFHNVDNCDDDITHLRNNYEELNKLILELHKYAELFKKKLQPKNPLSE